MWTLLLINGATSFSCSLKSMQNLHLFKLSRLQMFKNQNEKWFFTNHWAGRKLHWPQSYSRKLSQLCRPALAGTSNTLPLKLVSVPQGQSCQSWVLLANRDCYIVLWKRYIKAHFTLLWSPAVWFCSLLKNLYATLEGSTVIIYDQWLINCSPMK